MGNPSMRKRKRGLDDDGEPLPRNPKKPQVDSKDIQDRVDTEPQKSLVGDGDIYPSPSRYSNNTYTVGWICAITAEYVAAQLFLDEQHEGPEDVSLNDNNNYTLGRIREHNVVIAVLPDGGYGISSAASVGRDMMHSFPNIRVGLMVGVGGGAPSEKHDIRLGDIVVSIPRDGKGGVLQYDIGKTIQNQSFHRTGFLNQPPTLLRGAVNGLKAQYMIKGHRYKEDINNILRGKPKLQMEFSRPNPSSDRLYQPGVVHSATCGTDLSQVIPRNERTQDEDDPKIHYGTIASGSQLINDALVRDKLIAEEDILCFENEAAGLMNHFPCLVIRGICDYSDTHKNIDWQGYAAMTAAAYAKDLLSFIPSNKIEAERKMVDILSGVKDSVERLLHTQDRKEYDDILNWATKLDYAPQQQDFINLRQEGTGKWLLDSVEFQTWLDNENQTLFCPGIPGAGKTILTSIVVENLCSRFRDDLNVGIAYVYFNFRQQDEQKAENILASLLKQLADRQPSLPDSVKHLHRDVHKGRRMRPSFNEISTVLHSVASLYSRVFIIIDALDECQTTHRCRARLLEEILALQTKCRANVFATARPIPEITEKFDGLITLEIRAHEQDVRRYLDAHMLQLPNFVRDSHDLQEEIKTEIVKAIDGMFLLARLHIDSLIGKKSPKVVRAALKRLPTGSEAYNCAYNDAMERIEGQVTDQEELAKQVLSWITCARRRLTTSELQHALAAEIGECRLDETNLSQIEDMVSVCAGLVTVDEESGIIRLVHYTTQQYFERTWERWFPNVESDIATTCVTYLSFSTFESGFCQTDDEFEERLRSNHLYDYAARHWGHHASEASPVVEKLILSFLKSQAKISASSQAMLASRDYNGHSQRVPTYITGPHLAAYFGLKGVLVALLKDEYFPDLKDSYGCTPLSWAIRQGREQIVDLLLATPQVDADSTDKDGRTPLSWAAEKGDKRSVNLLLNMKGVYPDSRDTEAGQTPLSWAAENGHEEVVKLLLDTKRIDPDTKDHTYGQTPLLWAVEKGHEPIVRLLLASAKVDPNTKNQAGQAPLWCAIENGHETVVKLLLADGRIEPNVNNECGRIPLWYTLDNGHESIFEMLLASEKVNPNAKNQAGQTPLLRAAGMGHQTIVQLLLKNGADIEAKDRNGCTPLWWAIMNKNETIVKLLLDNGANIKTKDKDGHTPLWWASINQNKTIVQLLLMNGADIEEKDPNSQTPLLQAAGQGHKTTVELLLENGADIEETDRNGLTPLWQATINKNETIVQLLLKNGANIEAKDSKGHTPLWQAAMNNSETIVQLLLENGADIGAKNWDRWKPLLLATWTQNIDSVKLLLEEGANVEAKDPQGRKLLRLATMKVRRDIVGVFLREGADVKTEDVGGLNLLLWAIGNGNMAIVNLLFKYNNDIETMDDRLLSRLGH